MISMVEGFVQSQDVKIHYIANTLDEKKVSILFVPGIMMPAWIWEKQLEYFSKDFNVVAIEPRSQGDSDQTSEGHDSFTLGKDIEAVVNTLNLQQLILVGWSIGVPQVVNYAVNGDSKQLVGLVLIDGIVGTDPSLPFYQPMVKLWSEFQMNRIPNTEKFIKSIFKQPLEESYLKALIEVAMKTPTNTVMTLINNYILQDYRHLLPQIHVPTFIATIEGPRLEYMQQMNILLKNSHLEIFQSAGHGVFVDQPEKFNLSLEKFIRNILK